MAGPLPDYDATQPRKLLLTKKEINYLTGKLQQSGLTLVPLSLYTKLRKIKLEIALVKGKKKIDKRQQIKEREDKRKMQRILKQKIRGWQALIGRSFKILQAEAVFRLVNPKYKLISAKNLLAKVKSAFTPNFAFAAV